MNIQLLNGDITRMEHKVSWHFVMLASDCKSLMEAVDDTYQSNPSNISFQIIITSSKKQLNYTYYVILDILHPGDKMANIEASECNKDKKVINLTG